MLLTNSLIFEPSFYYLRSAVTPGSSVKWYDKLFLHFQDTAVRNATVIDDTQNDISSHLFDLRREIIGEVWKEYKSKIPTASMCDKLKTFFLALIAERVFCV